MSTPSASLSITQKLRSCDVPDPGRCLPFRRTALAWFTLLAVSAWTLAASAAIPVVQEWYVPMPEAQIREDYLVLAPGTNTICDSVTALTVPLAGTKIVIDHWEDGYEVDLKNPVQATTVIWGDGNDANGKPPGYTNDPASFTAGSFILMRNNVPLPRNAATILHDGRDRIGSTYGIVMTRAFWFTTPGPLLAESVEVRAVPDWGKAFVLPVGEDIIFPTPAASSMFEHCSAYIMAANNGTVVTIDADGPGAGVATTVTLNQGEAHLVNAGIKKGATITATKDIQVMEFYGDIGANYETRGANVPPLAKWSDDYYAPVGTASDGDDTYIYLYNPDVAAITVNYTTKVSSGSFSIPGKGYYQFLMPQDSAARFTSVGGKVFWGMGAVGAEPTANNVHDWGYALVPKDFLSTEVVVGWGAGSRDGTQNGNPVWVTSTGATTIYVDYNGDRLGPNTDSAGQKYDVALTVTPLTVSRVYETDKDQSGMRLYTLDGTRITAAWGQDPAVAGPAEPYLDLGNTVPNFPVPLMTKVSQLVVDNNTAGLSVGDVLEYTVTLSNPTLFSLAAIGIVDVLPAGVSYVANSSSHDGTALPDAGTTPFPMDEGGVVVPILQSKSETVVKFRVTITVAGTHKNTARVPGYPGVEASDTVVVPVGVGSSVCTLKLTNSSGTEVNYQPGDGIYVTVTDADANTSTTTVQTMTANVTNSTTGDVETITLTETGVNTGIFRNTVALPSSTSTGLGPNDGTLNVQPGNTLTATHADTVFGDNCSDTATITTPSLTKQLYLDTDGTDNDTAGDLDRVSPADVSPADTTTSQTSTLAAPAASTVTTGTTTSGSNVSVAAGGTLSFSHTPGSGTNRLLLVSVGVGNTSLSDTAASGTVSGVAFGGTAMTLVNSVQNGSLRTYVFQLVNPASAAANVVVSISGKTASVSASATTFTGVHQSTPLGTSATNASTTDSTALTATVASASGELVYSTAAVDEGVSNQSITTSTAGSQAELVKNSGFNFATTASSTKPGAASVTTTYTAGDAQEWAVIVVPIKPAPGTSGGSATWTQTPSFAEAFSMPSGGSLGATAYYTVSSGSMPASPAVTAVLRKNGTAFATSSSASASATTGSGLLTFTFPALGSAQSFTAGDVISLVVSNNQSGVAFTVDYDSSTKPSKITLPTNTVIHNDSVVVYDAPYPGGSVVTTPTAGQTLYVRVTAGDPFGAYDITSLPLVIDGPGATGDVSTTLTDTNVVASTAATKTYQYAWVTGSTEGNFNITATAKEGFENTITSARSSTVNLSSLDLGTPSITEFTSSLNGPGTLTYAPNGQVFVRITDLDQNTNPAVAETITAIITTSSGDSELVTLTETGVNTGVFVVGIPASATVAGTSNNGTLYAPAGAALTASYVDPTDPTDTSSDAASVPSGTPGVSVVKTLLSPTDGQIVVGEAAQYRLRVTNTGNTTLNTVQVVDTFPAASLTYASATPVPNTVAAGSLTWTNVGPLTAGQSVDVIVNFTGLAAANPATNTVNVTTGGGPTASDTEPVIVTRPEVSVTKTLVSPNPGPANKGDNVVYNLTVQNTGTTVLNTVPLEDTYSAALYDFVSATVAPNSSGAGSLVWNDVTGAGTLAVNATFSVSVTLKAKGAATLATNSAAVLYAVDANNDPVPPDISATGVQTLAAAVSGYVYEDKGTAGFGGGDTALLTVTVKLYSDPNGDGNPADGTVLAVTTTDSSGYYEFLNLGLGTYVVVEEDPVGYSSIDDTAGADTDNRVPVNVAALTTYPNNNFLDDVVNPANFGTINGQVRNDTDADGSFADPDSGLTGAVVTLYTDPNGDGDPTDGTPYGSPVTTTSTGTYSFTMVPPGTYVVVETNPSGYISTADVANPNNDQIPVTVVASGTVTGRDFLDTNNTAALGTIGNQIWTDTNNNGLLDGGETGINGVVVQLYLSTQTPGVDLPYTSTTTFGGGLYSFTNVPAGSYKVYLPVSNFGVGGALATAPLSSTVTDILDNNENNDDNGIQTASGAAVSSPVIVLAAAETDNTIDFGFVPTASLGGVTGTVKADTNNDNTGDAPLPGVTVTLFTDPNGDGNPVDGAAYGSPVTTATDGSYSFTSVPPGNYVVVETQPSGYLTVTDVDSTTPGDDVANSSTTDNRIPVGITAGETDSGNDFVEEQPAVISGLVLKDTNNDNVGDVGFSGVTLTLFTDPNGDGNPADGVAFGTPVTTAGDGSYSFTNVPPGSYVVVQTQPSGHLTVTDADTSTDTVGSPADAANSSTVDNRIPVNVMAGETDGGNSFVEEQPGIISGSVKEDTDNNGSGDTGISGVTLTLFTDPNGDGNPADGAAYGTPVTTATDGSYSFTNLPPGSYVVVETQPSGFVTVSDGDSTTPGDDAANSSTSDNRIPVAVTANETDNGNDFVEEVTPGGISGYVLADINNDNTGDTGILGVVLTLLDASGNPVDDPNQAGVQPWTATTLADGSYGFIGVPPGTYKISEVQPLGYLDVTDADGGNPNLIGDVTPIVLTSGSAITGRNFIEEQPATVSGHLYLDTNGDGNQDPGEPDLANVDVLITKSDTTTVTVTTDANGDWSATVPPGSTTANVQESDPQYPTGSTQTEGTDPTTVTALAGTNTDGGIDGYYVPATVTGHLYRDTNGDGNQDPGEPDLANVDVIVTDSNGTPQTVVTDANGDWSATVPPGSTTANVQESDPQYPTGSTQTEGTDPTTVTAVAGASTDGGIDGYYIPATVGGHLYLDTNGDGNQDPGEPDLASVDVIVTDSNGTPQTVSSNANGDWTATVPPGSTTANVQESDPQYPAGSTQTEGTDPTTITAVAGADTDGGIDGYYIPGTVSGHLYLDTNGDGDQDPGEPDLANVDVIVTDSNGTPQTVSSDANGDWTATVPPGSTTANVQESDPQYPAGSTQTEGTEPTPVTAVAGVNTSAGIDGYFIPGTVTGHLYLDTNGDGDQDVGEPNLANVDVIVTDSNGTPQTVVTNATGDWSASVPPGSATADVQESDPQYPAGSTQTEGTDPTTVTAVAGVSTDAGIDGYYVPGTVSGHLYLDSNGDGDQDPGEPDLANVDVIVTDSNGTPQTVSSDANGDWAASVPPGSTTANVQESDPQYPAGSSQTEGTDPTTVTAVAGVNTDAGIDGYYIPGTVTGHLYLDTNGDGDQDPGEPDLANVDVIVTDSNGTPQTVSSDANGDWTASVPPGSTTADVQESDPQYPAGSTQTEGTDPTTVTAVAGVNTDAGIDGYFIPGTVSGHLYLDSNGDGNQDPGEPDLADIDVIVTDSNGNPQTVSTDANGDWSATVPPGSTTANVDNTDPDFPANVTQTEGTDPTTVTAVAGVSTDAGNDGYFPPATVTGHLYVDTNGDGDQDPGEPDLANIDVIITKAVGGTVTVSTDASGNWTASVPPGTTTANVDNADPQFPANVTQTEGTDPTTVTAVAATTTSAGNDGYFPPATVTGHLYLDTNGDGDQDPGEPDLANVDVIVTDSNGTPQTVSSDANGDWSASVPPGSTTANVQETDPQYPAGSSQTEGTDPTTVTAVAGVSTDAGIDGYFIPGTVSGHLYLDTNGDGDQDPGEPDLANVDVIVTNSNGIPQTVSSDANGDWTASVPPGSTTANVQESDPQYPAGSSQTEGTDPTTVTAVSGVNTDAGIDGYFIPGTVSGHLYLDTNGDGDQDPGEPDLANVDVIVTNSNGTPQTVSSDANGDWSASVPPGSTTANVQESDPQYPAGSSQTEGTDPTTVTAVAGVNTDAGIDGYYIPGTVTGHLYLDTNGDGNQDPGEPDLANVDVIVTDSNGTPQTVSTDVNGDWTASVPPGSTTANVQESDPQYPAGSSQTEGTDPTTVTAVAGVSTDAGIDGYFISGTVSGHLYLDTNGDGNQDPGEPDLANVDVIVTDSNGTPQTVSSDANGDWSASVPPGSTTANVQESDPQYPAGSTQTEGTDPTTVTAVAGVNTDAGIDGYFIPGTVTGHLYVDTNGDGNQDPGEPDLANVDVLITKSDTTTVTVTTDANGNWTVSVPPGSTTANVQESDPQYPTGSSQTEGTDPTTVTAVAGASTNAGIDGYFRSGSIGNLVWVDANNNGLKDGGEAGLDGVVVELLDGSGNPIDSDAGTGGVQPTTMTTAGGGLYSFGGLAPGSYQVRIATPPVSHPISSSVTDTADNGEDNDDNGSQNVAGGIITSPVITLAAAEHDQTMDFGLVAPASIGNLVWNDVDDDGVKDPAETGLDGVVLVLKDGSGNDVDDPNQTGVQPYVVTTAGGGLYAFTNLVPGSYQIVIATPPSGYLQSSSVTDTADNGQDNDDNGTQTVLGGPVAGPVIALAHGESDSTVDFGFTQPTGTYTIAGQVRDDYNANGNLNDPDRPIPGVTVKLFADSDGSGTFDPNLDTLVDTTTTDGLGNYEFTNLPDGVYFVQETDPTGASSTADSSGNNDNVVPVTIAGADSTDNDFLDAVDPAGYIYSPVDGSILPGGTISVSGPGVVTILMDGSTGQYSFIIDGTPGTYVVTYNPPLGYMVDPQRPVTGPSFDPTGGANPTLLGSGEDPLNPGHLADFTAGANPYYLTFVLAPGDPLVINNNLPVVETKPSTFAGWQYANPLGGQNGPTQDPDGDGITNLEEFAFCYNPGSGLNGGCPLELVVNGDGTIDALVRRVEVINNVTYNLEFISSLGSSGASGAGWTDVSTIVPTVTSNGDGTETALYHDLATIPGLSTAQGFVRVRVNESTSGSVARTDASGWAERTAPQGVCQTFSMPFVPCAPFLGAIDSATSSAINVTTAAGGLSVKDAMTATGKAYYVEVLSGTRAGHRFEVDVAGSTATSIALAASSIHHTLTPVPALTAGDRIALRSHWTMEELFPVDAFTGTTDPTTGDKLNFFNAVTQAFQSYWLYDSGSAKTWVADGDATLSDAGGRLMDPAEGLFLTARGSSVGQLFAGVVRETPFAMPLRTGSNFVGGGWPMAQSPNSRGMSLATGFTGSNNPATADRIQTWKPDVTNSLDAGYNSDYLLNYPGYQQWTPQGSASLLNDNATLLFESLRAAMLRSVSGHPTYVAPVPWTP